MELTEKEICQLASIQLTEVIQEEAEKLSIMLTPTAEAINHFARLILADSEKLLSLKNRISNL